MKKRTAVLLAALVAFAIAGGALAATGKPGKPAKHAKPAPTKPVPAKFPPGIDGELAKLGLVCQKPTVDISGSFGSQGGGFMAVAVEKATGKAGPLVGKQVAIRLLNATNIERNGKVKASALKAGDALKVQALTCSQGIVAKHVVATPKK